MYVRGKNGPNFANGTIDNLQRFIYNVRSIGHSKCVFVRYNLNSNSFRTSNG